DVPAARVGSWGSHWAKALVIVARRSRAALVAWTSRTERFVPSAPVTVALTVGDSLFRVASHSSATDFFEVPKRIATTGSNSPLAGAGSHAHLPLTASSTTGMDTPNTSSANSCSRGVSIHATPGRTVTSASDTHAGS